MNITLSADDELIRKAREIASRQGTSLNELVRRYFESLVGEQSRADAAAEFRALCEQHAGHSGGHRFRREDAYDPRRIGTP